MHEEANELIRIQNRLKQSSEVSPKPSALTGLSIAGRSSSAVNQKIPELPSLADGQRKRALNSLDDEQTLAFYALIEVQMKASYVRIEKLRDGYKKYSG